MHQNQLRWCQRSAYGLGSESSRANAPARREMVSRVGVHFALEQCHDLLDNDVAGIHFYTLNRSDATRTIFDSLGIPRQRSTQVPIDEYVAVRCLRRNGTS